MHHFLSEPIERATTHGIAVYAVSVGMISLVVSAITLGTLGPSNTQGFISVQASAAIGVVLACVVFITRNSLLISVENLRDGWRCGTCVLAMAMYALPVAVLSSTAGLSETPGYFVAGLAAVLACLVCVTCVADCTMYVDRSS